VCHRISAGEIGLAWLETPPSLRKLIQKFVQNAIENLRQGGGSNVKIVEKKWHQKLLAVFYINVLAF
jgi:hypothetical protein